jgi:hypothetical protein
MRCTLGDRRNSEKRLAARSFTWGCWPSAPLSPPLVAMTAFQGEEWIEAISESHGLWFIGDSGLSGIFSTSAVCKSQMMPKGIIRRLFPCNTK